MKKQIWKKLVIFTLAVAVVMAFALTNQNARLFASEGEEVAAQEPAPAPAPEPAPAPAPEPAPAPAPEPAPASVEEPAPAPAPAEEPKAEEPKAEEPKAEEPKAEEPKAEEPKAEEPKVEEPKAEEPKAEQPESSEEKKEEAEEAKTEQTEKEEKKEEKKAEEEPVLPAAQIPITVKLVDAQGAAVGDGVWNGTVAFAEGQTAADVTLPAVEGYVTPALKVERTKDTTALNVTAIYTAVKVEKASFTATFTIVGSENGKVTAAGAEATSGYSLKLTEGETLTFTAAPNEGCTVTVRINGAEVAVAVGNTYSIPMDGDKAVTITFAKPQTEEAETEEAEAEKIPEEKPNRSIHLSLAGNPTTLKYGDSVTLVATLTGFEDVEYTVAWQYSADGSSWQNCGVTGETMTVVVSPENANNYWNVLVTVTGKK